MAGESASVPGAGSGSERRGGRRWVKVSLAAVSKRGRGRREEWGGVGLPYSNAVAIEV